jgi:hypothetical protein
LIITGGNFFGKRFVKSVSPILTRVSGPRIAIPFSGFSVSLFFFLGATIGITSSSFF